MQFSNLKEEEVKRLESLSSMDIETAIRTICELKHLLSRGFVAIVKNGNETLSVYGPMLPSVGSDSDRAQIQADHLIKLVRSSLIVSIRVYAGTNI